MSKHWAVSIVALIIAFITGLTFARIARVRNTAAQAGGEASKWNNIPPRKSAYAGKKSAPAPRRDISGIWDAAALDGGFQVNGAFEHPALYPQKDGAVE